MLHFSGRFHLQFFFSQLGFLKQNSLFSVFLRSNGFIFFLLFSEGSEVSKKSFKYSHFEE